MIVFLAINYSNKIKESINSYVRILKKQNLQCDFVDKANFHTTLIFLGDCKDNEIEIIEEIMNKIKFDRFEVDLEGIGIFKNRKSNIIWLGLNDNYGKKELHKLQGILESTFYEKGFYLPKREFIPHVTLARNVEFANDFLLDKVEKLTRENLKNIKIKAKINSFSLIKSAVKDEKRVYTEICRKYLSI